MENMNLEPKQAPTTYTPERRGSGFTMFLIFAVIALIVAAVAIWFSIGSTMNKLTKQTDQMAAPTSTPSAAITQPPVQQANSQPGGLLKLQPLDGTVGQVGKPITFAIVADSMGQDVVGFDIVLDYHEGQFDFQNAVANANGFKIATSTQKGVLAISGYKLVGAKSETVFNNTQIATLTLMPKQTGSFTISPVTAMGNTTSKMITSDKKITVPRLESASVVIGN